MEYWKQGGRLNLLLGELSVGRRRLKMRLAPPLVAATLGALLNQTPLCASARAFSFGSFGHVDKRVSGDFSLAIASNKRTAITKPKRPGRLRPNGAKFWKEKPKEASQKERRQLFGVGLESHDSQGVP